MKPKTLTRLLQDLIAIPSVNPHGDAGVPAHQTGENVIADYVLERFREIGLSPRKQTVYPGRPNALGFTASSKGKKPVLLLCPHIDTVSVLGMTINPFDPKIKNGRVYGRGACDDKGPLSAMLWALGQVLKNRPKELRYDVVFAAVMGEEAGNDGIRHLMKSGQRADFVIAGEPTDLNPVHTHKGAMWMKLTARGVAVHSSQPHKGENAIYKLARAITYLETEQFPRLQKIKNRVLGSPTLSVGTMQGGSKVNIVPDFATCEVDFRLVPEQKAQKVLTEIRAGFKKHKIDVEVSSSRNCQALYTDPANPHIRKLATLSKQMAGRGKVLGAPWFCDASIASEYRLPAIAWGPGSIAQAHTKDEFIEISELEKGAAIFEEFLTQG
ncbi:MAG: M20 family metallopeptidase [Verrucomicrobiae bacterium]|nr:M20 family metallopeptidase [Verrucomicrobiae bacterium]